MTPKQGPHVCFLVLLVCASFATPALLAQNYIYGRADFLTGNNPADIIVGDFNGDHRPDLAVTNFDDNTVSILLATSGGGYAPKVDYPTGQSPTALLTADLNGDGKLDLAIVDENGGTVSVLLGNGDGTFQGHVDYPVGSTPIGIAAGNFTGNGKVDLAVADLGDNAVAILLGNGDGSFEVQALVPVGTGPNAFASGDFNGDGKIDLITSNDSGTVSVLLSRGDGTFTRVDSQSESGSPVLALADFNNDGKLDVVVASSFPQQMLLLLGRGDGTFQTPAVILNSGPPIVFTLALAGDFNGDGRADVAVGGVSVLLGNGDGTFQAPIESPFGAMTLTAADLNGDGQLDIVGPETNFNVPNKIDVLLGAGNGTFGSLNTVSLAQTPYGSEAAVAADFNGDGKLDLAVAESNFPNGQVSVELGRGNGTFRTPIISPILGSGTNTQGLAFSGDFNGDGKADLVLLDDYDLGFQVLISNGDGSFQAPLDNPFTNSFISLAVGDFNGDGKSDVVVTSISNLNGPVMNVYLSNGDGTFHAGAQYAAPGYPFITVADVNHDGKLDVVGAGSSSPLLVFLGNGDGTFASPLSGPSDQYQGTPVAADFNGDGKIDVVAFTGEGVAFMAGNGNGTFQNQIYSNSSLGLSGSLRAADCSGDGKLDLVNYGFGVEIMVGNGDGTFQSPISYSSTGLLAGAADGDFNSDHVSDIAIADENDFTGLAIVTLYSSVAEPFLFPTALTFGYGVLGQISPPQNISVTNQGNAPLKISGITASGDFTEQNNCGTTLAVGKICTIQVSFKPAADGAFVGKLKIADNAPPGSQVIPLRGGASVK